NAQLAGKPYLVFFGFTHCPDICPTTLFELTDLMAELGPAADRFTPLFITVDPERDTQQVLVEYMTAFDERILALRGSQEETDATVKAFAAYYRKVPVEGGGYTMDHTAGVILMDAEGRFVGTLDMHEPRENVLAKLRRLVNA
ncbi:MAG: SCO family protein, partial [Pararhizobium sp.]